MPTDDAEYDMKTSVQIDDGVCVYSAWSVRLPFPLRFPCRFPPRFLLFYFFVLPRAFFHFVFLFSFLPLTFGMIPIHFLNYPNTFLLYTDTCSFHTDMTRMTTSSSLLQCRAEIVSLSDLSVGGMTSGVISFPVWALAVWALLPLFGANACRSAHPCSRRMS